jgi:hypothetical protein
MKQRIRLTAGAGWGVGLLLLGASIDLRGQTPAQSGRPGTQLMDPRRDTGQSVAPVFEGWEPNPDGTVSMYFGYMNRNWKEELDIPIGPNNFFGPGAQDRGQPTHFLPRRGKQFFAVAVPRDFKDTLTWTLSIRGVTEHVPGSLKPEQQIDVHKDTQNGNTPPTVEVGPALTASAGQAITLSVGVTDDGLPKAPRNATPGSPIGLRVVWSKYRGPGKVAFSNDSAQVKDGKAVTTATFSEPGVYWVLALADDGSIFLTSQGQHVPGFACCWTAAHLTVTVN